MWKSFQSSRRRGLGRVYVYFDRAFPERPLGWLLLRKSPPWAPDTEFDVMVYVDDAFRRSGYGRKLYKAATKGRGPIAAYPWDCRSEDFFYGFKNMKSYEGWSDRGIDLVCC